MTYHVNLLLDEEQRSASRVNVGLALRMSAMIAAAAIILVTMTLFIESRDVEGQVKRSRAEWESLKPQYTEVLALRKELDTLRASFRQIETFRRSRLAVGKELTQLQRGIPEEIQLTSLHINQLVGNQKTGAGFVRSYEMHLSGRTSGESPKENVDKLIGYLQTSLYTGRVEAVFVPPNAYRKETARTTATGETHTDWFFELVCRYRPRSFE